DPNRVTVADYFASWLNSPGGRSPKTLERYDEAYRHQIKPHLGNHALQKLLPEHVREWHGKLIETGISARTIGHAHRLLRLVLECAVKEGKLRRNVAGVHRPPKAESKEIEILSADQVRAVLDALDGHALYPIAALAIHSGMRRGELLGIQWGDIDLDAGTL